MPTIIEQVPKSFINAWAGLTPFVLGYLRIVGPSEPLCGGISKRQPFKITYMSQFKQWERAYAFLNDDEQKDPIRAICATTSGDGVFYDRTQLVDILFAALGSRMFQDYDAKQIQHYLYAWKRAIEMIECCHRLQELMANDQVHYSYSGVVDPT